MTEPATPAERYRRVARGFTDRVAGVPEGGWDDPTPCDGWAGRHTVADAICQFVLGDVLVHTWDLARATGQDESLDPEEVATMRAGVEPILDVLVGSGHYGPRVVSDERFAALDPTGQLVALFGREV